MKLKYFCFILSVFYLSGCGNLRSGQQKIRLDAPSTDIGTEIETATEVAETADELVKGQELFLPENYFNQGFSENEQSEHENFRNFCLNSLYDHPQDVDLKELFYDGFKLPIDEEDRSFLEKQGAQMYLDIIKLPRTEMDNILMQYFGITLSETNMVGMEDFYYNADKDIYYLVHSDTHYQYIEVIEQYLDENGNLNVVYTWKENAEILKECGSRRAVLKKEEDRYVFFSNQIESEMDEEALNFISNELEAEDMKKH